MIWPFTKLSFVNFIFSGSAEQIPLDISYFEQWECCRGFRGSWGELLIGTFRILSRFCCHFDVVGDVRRASLLLQNRSVSLPVLPCFRQCGLCRRKIYREPGPQSFTLALAQCSTVRTGNCIHFNDLKVALVFIIIDCFDHFWHSQISMPNMMPTLTCLHIIYIPVFPAFLSASPIEFVFTAFFYICVKKNTSQSFMQLTRPDSII